MSTIGVLKSKCPVTTQLRRLGDHCGRGGNPLAALKATRWYPQQGGAG